MFINETEEVQQICYSLIPNGHSQGVRSTKLRLAKVEDETSSKAIRIYNYDVK